MSTAHVPPIEATESDSDALADIIWFINGRMSALADQGRSFELDGRHVDALRRFRVSLPNMHALRQRAESAEKRADLADHWMNKHRQAKAKK